MHRLDYEDDSEIYQGKNLPHPRIELVVRKGFVEEGLQFLLRNEIKELARAWIKSYEKAKFEVIC